MIAAARLTVGRNRELGRLDSVIERLGAGAGSVVVIEGEPGIGKSQLVSELRLRADELGARALVGYGEPLERGRPLHVFDRSFNLGAVVGEDVDDRGQAFEPMLSGRHQIREQMLAALEREALEPVVVVAEDLHWADEASLLVIIDAIRMSESMPIVVALTCRPHPRSLALARVLDLARRRADHEWFELGPLDADDVRQLAESESGSPRFVENDGVLDSAGGNPFLVLELVRASSLGDPQATSSVPLDRISHLHYLGEPAHACIRAAAVLGTRFDLATLTAMLETPLATLVPLLEQGARASVLALTDGGAEFRHDLIREALYADIPSDLRTAHHRRAASSILDRGGSPVEAAEHLLLGSSEGDVGAQNALAEAARRLVTIDPERSLELLDRVDGLDETRRLGDHAARLETRIRALAAIGRLDEALDIGRRVAAMGPAAVGRDDLAEVLAGVAFLANRPQVGLDELERASARATDPVHRARLDAQTSLMQMASGDVAGGMTSATAAASAASELGDPVARSLALSVSGRLITLDHQYERGRELGADAVSAAEIDPTPESHRWLPWLFLGLTELDLDNLEGVEVALERGQVAARRARTPWAEPLYTALAASAALRAGAVDDAMSLAESAVGLSRSFESTQALAWAHATAGLSMLAWGDLAGATSEAGAARTAGESGSMLGADHVVRLNALVSEQRGDVVAAFDELFGAWQLFEAVHVYSCQPVLAPELTRVAVVLDRTDVASAVAKTMAGIAEGTSPSWIHACAMRCGGLATNDADQLARAVDLYRSTVRRLDLAETLVELAKAVPADERPRLIDEAVGLYEACGASGAAAALSPHSVRSTSSRAVLSDWDRLTATELAIVELTCEGLTNTETAERRGISRRTVESHLARAFRKLGVRTRSQLLVLAMGRRHDTP